MTGSPGTHLAVMASIVMMTSVAVIAPVPAAAGDADAQVAAGAPTAKKLYWLIPDGLRADPDLFTLFEWAQTGQLPNIRRMMDEGAWGYSIPDFPSHTPTNFASLLTGTHPVVHGVADGPMHTEGAPLHRPSVGGFSSVAKKVPPIWSLLEAADRRVALLSLPGSTPPELNQGITLRGRWGGWGADTPAVVFEPLEMLPVRKEAGKAFKLFFLGQKLTEFVETRPAAGWRAPPRTYSPAREATLAAYGLDVHILVSDSSDDARTNYDTVTFSGDKHRVLWALNEGRSGDWQPVTLSWKGQAFESHVRARLIKLWGETGAFRIRLFFNNLNRFNTMPPEVAAEVSAGVGPMVDFVDNWPQQLVYEDEDELAFLDEVRDSLAWHRSAAGFVLQRYRPDVFIHDTYTPNQMLESRWWHRHVDPARPGHDPARAVAAWHDLLTLYRGIDAILGEAIKNADAGTLFALSSDHGVISVAQQVRLNNLFARKGWLKFDIDEATGEPAVDWERTRVIYLKMAHVYIHPDGLGGDWTRASGDAYEALRAEVVEALGQLEDADGVKPLVRAVKWEEAPQAFGLPVDRVGDLVLEVVPGYTWWEEVTADLALFTVPLTSGYKQAVDARSTPGMWTPFVIMGPGVRQGVELAEPISHVGQMPTLLKLLGVNIPEHVEGRVLSEILAGEGE